MPRNHPFIYLALLLIFIVSCSEPNPAATPALLPSNTPGPVATATIAPTTTPVATAIPTATPEATATATQTPSALSPIDIYAAVAPSIAMIETDVAIGSSVLIEGGYLVTNAHVVWPYDEARVVFSDGSEFENVPMVGWDVLNDLAVLGPIENDLPTLALESGEALPVGSPVYLIGFPGEVDKFPQASITQGLISRYREWALEGVTYFQTDAEIAGGQSGGVLVSQLGDVIGISGFSFTETDFGVVASTADVAVKIEAMIAGDDSSGAGARLFPTAGGMNEVRVTLANEWDSANFIVYGDIDDEWQVTLNGRSDGAIVAYDADGFEVLFADEELDGEESAEIILESDAPHFLQIYTFDSGRSVFNIESNLELIPLDDPDDLAAVAVGSTYRGNIDFAGDFDTLVIDLDEGETVNILVDSVLVDPFITVRSAGGSESVTNDDAGGGLFGVSAELTYKAATDGKHFIVIESAFNDEYGGYIAQISEPTDESPTPVAPEPTATPRASLDLDLDLDIGKLSLYRSDQSQFAMRYPATWSNDASDDSLPLDACESIIACFANADGVLSLVEADISSLPDDITLDGYAKIVVDDLEALGDDFNLLSSERFVTDSGLEGVHLVYEFTGLFTVYRAIVITEDFRAFNPSYIFFENADDYAELALDTFRTIALGE